MPSINIADMIEDIDFTDAQESVEPFNYKKHVVSYKEINNGLEDFLTGKIKKGYGIGIDILDNHFVFKENEFYALTGKKGSGKTTINQLLHLCGSIAHGLKWVVAYQENNYSFMKLNLMNYLLCGYSNNIYTSDRMLYDKASDFIDKHFIFIDVESIKEALMVTECLITQEKINIHAVVLDPVNSFMNGWQDTGNGYSDGVVAGINMLNFTKKVCSIHISQHPTMSGQRQEGAVTSYQAEGGWFLNKASFTYVIHREQGTNSNELIVENVRNKHTGGGETEAEKPVVIEWSPTQIRLYYKGDFTNKIENLVRYLTNKHRTFGIELVEEKKVIENGNVNDAFDSPY